MLGNESVDAKTMSIIHYESIALGLGRLECEAAWFVYALQNVRRLRWVIGDRSARQSQKLTRQRERHVMRMFRLFEHDGIKARLVIVDTALSIGQ